MELKAALLLVIIVFRFVLKSSQSLTITYSSFIIQQFLSTKSIQCKLDRLTFHQQIKLSLVPEAAVMKLHMQRVKAKMSTIAITTQETQLASSVD